jgi:HSP20 family protein
MKEHPSEKPLVSRVHETLPSAVEFGGIMSTLGSMERMLEEALRRPFGELFREFGTFGGISGHPAVDVYEHGNDVIVRCEIPGMKRDDISVKFLDDTTLIIAGERKSEEKVEKGNYLRHECSCGAFSRTLSLPEGIKHEKAKASYRDGILEIMIPKSEEAMSKTWTVPVE